MGFNSSLSGISAANADLSVTANNIANVNTVGFKESRAEFANVLTATGYGLQGNAMGSGARLTNVAQQFSQGNINQTGRSLDLAIAGEGFFTLSMDGARVYSRAGNFQPDKNGYIVNPQGARLQVYGASADGTRFDGALTDLRLLSGDSAPRPTNRVQLAFTLPANSKEPTINPFDPANSNSYNYSSGGITVYDSLGVSHTQTSYFVKTENPNEWEVYNFVDGVPVNDGSAPADPTATPPVPAVIGNPTMLTFSDSGALTTPTSGTIELGNYTPTTGAGQLAMRLDISGSTQFGEKFNQHNTGQDGYASGKLNEISISEKGVVFAHYSNGVDVALGQVALTNFNSPQGLLSQGNNLWSETFASGTPRTGAPDSADLGLIEGGALEASTVDLTQQLVNMITAQRNFQANAQMLSTQDQVTQTVINIR